MLDTILNIFYTILKIFGIYFAAISVFTLLRSKRFPETERRLRFAVLVPCRNEENCIAGLIESIHAQDYPPELIDVYVIPNNCTDDTPGTAKRAGALVLEVPDSVRCKGAALQEAFAQLLPMKSYDAFCVFDADNEADSGFIAAMNRTLCSGAGIAKSRILAKNRYQSWVCACYDIYFCLANRFLNRPRDKVGLSARVIGTGFAVTSELLEKLGGFQTVTITEDAEFYATLIAAGERAVFCEQAITYDEEPLSFKTSLTQRRRWMSGIMQVTMLKAGALARGLFRRKSCFCCFDTLLQFSFAYVQALLPMILALDLAVDIESFILALPMSLPTLYGSTVANAVLALALERRLTRRMWKGILLYPFFLYSFIPLQTISLFKRTTVWQEIHHTGVRRTDAEQKRRETARQ